MSELPNFCKEVNEQTCPTCPLHEIQPAGWEQVRPGIETELDLSEALKDAVFLVTSPMLAPDNGEPDVRIALALNEVDKTIMPLFDKNAYTLGTFAVKDTGQILLEYYDHPAIGREESEFGDTTRRVVRCLLQNQATRCLDRHDGSENMLPVGLVSYQSGANTLRVIALHGSDQEVRAILVRLRESALEAGLGDLRLPTDEENTAPSLQNADGVMLRRVLRVYAEFLESSIVKD